MTPRQRELSEMFSEAFQAGADVQWERVADGFELAEAAGVPQKALGFMQDGATERNLVNLAEFAKNRGHARRFAAKLEELNSVDASLVAKIRVQLGLAAAGTTGEDVMAERLSRRIGEARAASTAPTSPSTGAIRDQGDDIADALDRLMGPPKAKAPTGQTGSAAPVAGNGARDKGDDIADALDRLMGPPRTKTPTNVRTA